jgi:hypothetical protein
MLTFKQMQYSYIAERLVVFQPAISRQQSWYVSKHFFNLYISSHGNLAIFGRIWKLKKITF